MPVVLLLARRGRGLANLIESPATLIVIVVGIALLYYAQAWIAGRRLDQIKESGRPVAACLVMANDQLLSGQVDEAPACVIYCSDAHAMTLFPDLEGLATRMFELYAMPSSAVRRLSPAEREVARRVKSDRFHEDRRTRLPREFTDGRTIYAADLMLRSQPSWLAPHSERFVPCLITGSEKGQIMQLRTIDPQARAMRERIFEVLDLPAAPATPKPSWPAKWAPQSKQPISPEPESEAPATPEPASAPPPSPLKPALTPSTKPVQPRLDPPPVQQPWTPVTRIQGRPTVTTSVPLSDTILFGLKSHPLIVAAVVLAVLVGGIGLAYNATQPDRSAYTPGEIERLGHTNHPAAESQLRTLGEAPPRRGKVAILHAPVPTIRSGLPPRHARLADQWASLPDEVRADAPSEVGTLLSLLEIGSKTTLTVYDLEEELQVAQYDLSGWPEFTFGQHGTIDVVRFVELMPLHR